MSKNNKNSQRIIKAREMSKMRKAGGKGASKTQQKHGKRWTYRSNPEVQKRIAEQLKATQEKTKSASQKLLEGAGSAAKE